MHNRSLLTIVCFGTISFLCFSYFAKDRLRVGEGSSADVLLEANSAYSDQDAELSYGEASEENGHPRDLAARSGADAIIPEQPAPSSTHHDGQNLETEVQDKIAELKIGLQAIKAKRQLATEAGIAMLEIDIAQLEEQIISSQTLKPANRLTVLAQASGQLQDFEQKLASLANLLY